MGRKYTQEEFENNLHNKYPNVKIISRYNGSAELIKFICPCCGEIHESLAQTLIQGHFCKKNIGKNNPRKKNTTSFIEEIKNVDSNIKIIGEYVDSNTPIEFICACGRITKREPAQMLLGYTKCPYCSQNRITFKDFKEKLHNIRPNISLITIIDDNNFIGKRNKVEYICECGEKDIKPMESLLNGVRCPKCTKIKTGKMSRKTHEQYVKEVHLINPEVEILSNYDGGENPIKFKCVCGNIDYKNQARELTRKRCCCSKCNKSAKKNTQKFISEMNEINPNIIITGEYVNAETPISYICECGNEHKSSPSLLLMGHRCGHCNMSKSEYITKEYLEDRNIEYSYDYKFDDCLYKKQLKFDFYLPYYKTCVELDGEHHYRPVRFKGIDEQRALEKHLYTKSLDEIKNNYCIEQKINLIRIPYWDFDNIEQILDESLFI